MRKHMCVRLERAHNVAINRIRNTFIMLVELDFLRFDWIVQNVNEALTLPSENPLEEDKANSLLIIRF